MANRLKPEKLAAMLDMHSVGASVREIKRATGADRETTRTTLERVIAERVRLAELALEYFAMFLVPGPGEEIIDEICRILIDTCPLHPGFVRDDDDDVIGCTICARDAKARLSDGLKRHHARRKAEGRPIIPPRKKTAPTPSPVPPTPTPPSPSVRTKAQPKPVLSTVRPPTAAPVVPLELGAVVPGPAPKGRRHA